MTSEKPPMIRVPREEFLDFAQGHKSVTIEEVEVPIGTKWSIKSIGPPTDYTPETTTVWSFPDREDHSLIRADVLLA